MRVSAGFFFEEIKDEAVGKWETCFWFSTFPPAFVAGAVGTPAFP
jgi:hypothetical protein